MSHRITRPTRLAAFAALALLSLTLLLGVSAATARADTLTLAGGWTTLTTDPGTTKALVANKILPLPVYPSWVYPVFTPDGLALRYRFYITGGQIDSTTLAGKIYHSGGLKFVNLRNGKSLKVTKFTIDTVNRQLTAYVPALDVRVPILNLDLSRVQVKPGTPYTKVGPVGARLTDTAAGALNASLGTTIFTPGLKLGTATVTARFAQ